jgi:uncharacterized protein (TIGR03032 family)
MATPDELDHLWAHHHAQWRDPMQVISLWEGAAGLDRQLLDFEVRGAFWDALAASGCTLIVTREYEHLILALAHDGSQPRISYLKAPHPSGVAYDSARGIVHIALTRNPNQIMSFKPLTGLAPRLDLPVEPPQDRPLMPLRSVFYPGSLYMHDLAMIGGELYANAVGQNAVVRVGDDGQHEQVWYPRCIERDGVPVFGQNHIQLNSIAAGATPETSYYTASADAITALRPGHPDFPVDGRGVLFSGATRAPIARGLTRPHSARLHDGRVWIDNSGYGELVYVEPDGRSENVTVAARLPGWTRGLGFAGDVAFVGTSRVIPRFRQYAPGLDVDSSVCGLHAVDVTSGAVLGSLIWPYGNQIFAVEALPTPFTTGFMFDALAERATERETRVFYAYRTSK